MENKKMALKTIIIVMVAMGIVIFSVMGFILYNNLKKDITNKEILSTNNAYQFNDYVTDVTEYNDSISGETEKVIVFFKATDRAMDSLEKTDKNNYDYTLSVIEKQEKFLNKIATEYNYKIIKTTGLFKTFRSKSLNKSWSFSRERLDEFADFYVIFSGNKEPHLVNLIEFETDVESQF